VTPPLVAVYRVGVRDRAAAFAGAARQAGVPGAARATSPAAATAASISAAATAIAELADRLPSLLAKLPQPRQGEPPAGRVP
ncbi:hypothetical protein, partial [Microbacterium sp. CCNWLW44]|uniref:hypothetical protein n=1 Tax=Microbacterium sp. CCNWLW44 TaxID=3122068 RepID=UPI0030100E59